MRRSKSKKAFAVPRVFANHVQAAYFAVGWMRRAGKLLVVSIVLSLISAIFPQVGLLTTLSILMLAGTILSAAIAIWALLLPFQNEALRAAPASDPGKQPVRGKVHARQGGSSYGSV